MKQITLTQTLCLGAQLSVAMIFPLSCFALDAWVPLHSVAAQRKQQEPVDDVQTLTDPQV